MILLNTCSITYDFISDDSDDDNDVLTIKRKNIDLDDIPAVENNDEKVSKKKLVTKVAVAKKILKKKIVPNKKTVFDEDGQVSVL